ncbi:hypothetical protein DPMN_192415 [Dreissena polymorpha]|uniref:Uncharacterized protein n=1 Tax=Dreissena polymorpha TaxID=45954 RepID=A0A9D4B5R0_DREPO|nr:hypothetical protein DPMN_192415 [Dreissena polymorpha]
MITFLFTIADLRNIFVNSGATQTGNLTAKDLRKGMQILGLNPTMAEVKDLMKKYKVTAREYHVHTGTRLMNTVHTLLHVS